jgi:DNA repair protein RadA/Sms
MAGKVKSVYVCSECGYESPKWNGKCHNCGAWNSFVEETTVVTSSKSSSSKAVDVSSQIMELSEVDTLVDDVR